MQVNIPGDTYQVNFPDDTLFGGRGSLSDMVGLWIFDSESGTIRDETGLTGDIIITGNPVVETINGYKGLRLNDTATKQYGILSNADFASTISTTYTFLILCTPTDTDSTLLSQYNDGADDMRVYFGTQIYSEPAGDGLSVNSLDYTSEDLQAVIASADESSGDYVLDTPTDTEDNTGTIITDTGEDINIGMDVDSSSGPAGNLFHGVIHRLALFDRELSTAEKQAFLTNTDILNRQANYKVNL